MSLRILCMCGYVIQGDDDEELWSNARVTWASCTPSWWTA
jgi:hypothetical protein